MSTPPGPAARRGALRKRPVSCPADSAGRAAARPGRGGATAAGARP
jgi:hypothetical protein